MGGAHRKPTLFTCDHARASRMSIAVGTALTLLAGGGAAWGDVPAGVHALNHQLAPVRPAEPRDEKPLRVLGVPTGTTNSVMARTGRHHGPNEPITTRIARASAAAEAVAERLTEARAALDTLVRAQIQATVTLTLARTSTEQAESAAATWTRESFIAQASRPEGLVADPRTGMLGRPTAVLDLEAAEAQQRTATDAADRATAAVTAQRAHVATIQRDLDARAAELHRLRAARASALLEADRQRDAVEAALARKYLRDADGAAGKAAASAVNFALAQRGKPYEWGAEGPERFDCSGLVQTAYATADVTLPRTARPQYRMTKPVPVTALLPGDLLFFATDHSDWNTIHHVGVYLGRGLMVHAPTTGDVVRVAPVWWSEFFAAGRVVPGRPGHWSPAVDLRPDAPVRATARRPRVVTPKEPAPIDPATATPMVEQPKSPSPSPSEVPADAEGHTASSGRSKLARVDADGSGSGSGRTAARGGATDRSTSRRATADKRVPSRAIRDAQKSEGNKTRATRAGNARAAKSGKSRAGKAVGSSTGRAAGPRTGKAAERRAGKAAERRAAGPRTGKAAGPRTGKAAGPRAAGHRTAPAVAVRDGEAGTAGATKAVDARRTKAAEPRAARRGGVRLARSGEVHGVRAGGVRGTRAGGLRGVRAGEVRGVRAGEVRGTRAGEVRGTRVGEVRGVRPGEVRGTRAGEVRGARAGEVRGTRAGEVRGTRAGEVRGDRAGGVGGARVGTTRAKGGRVAVKTSSTIGPSPPAEPRSPQDPQ